MLAEINLVLSSLSGATNIAKGLVVAESAVDKADLKFKAAEMMHTLAEATSSMAQIKLELVQKEELIRNLEDKLKVKDTLVREYGVYYKQNNDGLAHGEAICSKCWDVDQVLVHIIQPTSSVVALKCPNCKQDYSGRQVKRFIEL
jgi:hypothetical protein